MRALCKIVAGCLTLATISANAQNEDKKENTTSYDINLFGSLSTGENTPFWMVNNSYGVVPLDANNGYLKAGVFHSQNLNKDFKLNAGLELVGAMPRYRNVFIQQLYVELGYKILRLNIGSKENHHSLWDNSLGSGDLILSNNATPIPEINLSIPEFTIIPATKGWLQFKGDFALGRSFDNKYLEDWVNEKQIYVKNILWHHKSLYLQIKDTKGNFPLSAVAGVQHWAQWGGTSSNPKIGKQPQSIMDFLRIICAKEGGAKATASDQINVLGNHYGSYDFKIKYTGKDWNISGYYQHYFDDKSGMVFRNGTDGLWGLEANLSQFKWINKIVGEYITTRNQSGPFHYIDFDRENYKGPGNGADNYYNNGEYQTGVSYMGHSIGNPLIIAPMYNQNGELGFKCNRMRAWVIGLKGDISDNLSYKLKYSYSEGFGSHYNPYIHKKYSNSGMAEISYKNQHLQGWEFKGAVAADRSQLYGNTTGFSLTVSKTGIIKSWK